MGIRTTKQVKRIGCATLKDLIERDNLIIEDFDTISELTTFIGKSTSWEADDGAHDDLVMTMVLFSWLVQQRYFKELTDQDIREKMFAEQMKLIEEELVPFGYIEDGNDPDEFQIPGDTNVWKPAGDKNQYEYFQRYSFFLDSDSNPKSSSSFVTSVFNNKSNASISFSNSGRTLRSRKRYLTLSFSIISLLTRTEV